MKKPKTIYEDKDIIIKETDKGYVDKFRVIEIKSILKKEKPAFDKSGQNIRF